jgi:signal transduction histidine kinase/FixJ family two-component response regulator
MPSVEKILIVDDDAVVRGFINDTLTGSGYECLEVSMAQEVFALMAEHRISLILLDIKLPDQDGLSLLPQIRERDEDICAVMMTGVVDIRTAIPAIRSGAFDYIIKPFTVDELHVVVSRALNKRRLEIENKNYQRSIEEKNLRLEILHDLSVRVAYYLLSTVELEDIFRTILVGITAGEGLGFNRAFLALFDDDGSVLRGKMAVGPDSPEEAGRIWSALKETKYTLAEALEKCGRACQPQDARVNQIVREIVVPGTDMDHIFIRAAHERRAFHVAGRRVDGRPVRDDIVDLFGVDEFAVVPLCSPYRVQGIIIADNFITGKPIKEEDIAAIELFANQASMAIEKSRLYSELAAKLAMLEAANKELQESRDLLIQAERLSAIGEMAAQIAHEMRNPLVSIGGLARFIQRHTKEDKHRKHLDSIVKETEKMEEILAQVFKFIQSPQLTLSRLNLNDIVSSSLSALSPSFEKFHIEVETAFAPDMPDSALDGNQMRQAVINICKNSVEAMPSGGRLRVSTRVTPQNIEVEISDTGTGIHRDMLDKARQPFFTTKTYGVGLGLNIAEQIVRAHKGKMEISSGLGTGVRVNITLPRSA